jgi:hypothetical protein
MATGEVVFSYLLDFDDVEGMRDRRPNEPNILAEAGTASRSI